MFSRSFHLQSCYDAAAWREIWGEASDLESLGKVGSFLSAPMLKHYSHLRKKQNSNDFNSDTAPTFRGLSVCYGLK